MRRAPLLIAMSLTAVACVIWSTQAWSSDASVRIVGYINVTKGCQAATVKYLKGFAAKHSADVSLEIVDFGADAGRIRWQKDGYTCETIVINGFNQFRVGEGDNTRLVALKMPEGVRWTFEDLAGVLAREMQQPGSASVTDAEAQQIALRKPVAWRQSKWRGKKTGDVIVAAQTVFRFTTAFNGKSAVQRAKETAAALKNLYDSGLQADDVHSEGLQEGNTALGLVVAKDRTIATVGAAEARVLNKAPLQAAQAWSFVLREALRLLGR